MSTETNNDRATAIAIAQAQASVSVTVASAQAAAQYDAASAQVFTIFAESENQSTARLDIAYFDVLETNAIAYSRAESIASQAANSVRESAGVATNEVALIQGNAATDATGTKAQMASQVASLLGESSAKISETGQVAQIQAQADLATATIETSAIASDSQATLQEIQGTTLARVLETQTVAGTEAIEIASVVDAEDRATIHNAEVNLVASAAIAKLDAAVLVSVATSEAASRVYEAGKQSDSSGSQADSQSRLVRSGADQDLQAALIVAGDQSQGTIHGADDRYSGVLAREDGEDHRLRRLLDFAEAKFDELFPLVKEELDGFGAQVGPSTPGLGSPWPVVSCRGVFTPRMSQIQANSAYIRSDVGFGTGFRKAQADLTGRGLSGNSPALDAIRVGLAGRGLREAAEASTSGRIATAKANAERVLRSQTLRGQSFLDENRVAIGSEANSVEREVGLLKGVAEIIAGLVH